MKSDDRIIKAYAQLKPEQQAAIAFRFTVDHNITELNKLESAVQWKRYRAMDLNYRHSLRSIFDMASYFAVEYWKSQAMLYAALAQSAESLRENDADAAEAALEAVAAHRVRISVLVHAMTVVCGDVGIEPGPIWQLTGADPVPAGELWTARPDWLGEMVETLRSLRQPQ